LGEDYHYTFNCCINLAFSREYSSVYKSISGLLYAMKEDVKFTGGDIKIHNFKTYEIPKFSWIPEIKAVVLDRNEPSQGGGEPAIN